MTTATAPAAGSHVNAYAGTTIPFDAIDEPGLYICKWSGHLLRVPEGYCPSGMPRMNIVGNEPLLVTKLSDNPALTVPQAKRLAADLDLQVEF